MLLLTSSSSDGDVSSSYRLTVRPWPLSHGVCGWTPALGGRRVQKVADGAAIKSVGLRVSSGDKTTSIEVPVDDRNQAEAGKKSNNVKHLIASGP